MIYHYREVVEGFEELEALHAHASVTGSIIQWHRDDFTVVAEAPFEIVGKQRKGTPRLKIGDGRYEVDDLEGARRLVLEAAQYAVVGESDQKHFTVWYGFGDVVRLERTQTFAEEATELVESFVEAMVPLAEATGTPEHVALVMSFFERYADFLEGYKSLTRSDVARYISKIGISEVRAERDLEVMLALVQGYSST